MNLEEVAVCECGHKYNEHIRRDGIAYKNCVYASCSCMEYRPKIVQSLWQEGKL
jgi:hypothetical protein